MTKLRVFRWGKYPDYPGMITRVLRRRWQESHRKKQEIMKASLEKHGEGVTSRGMQADSRSRKR